MAKGLIIYTNGRSEVREFDTYDSINDALGGYIEGVFGSGWTAYCNEEGKLIGLPVNHVATSVARMYGWLADDVLCGPVVFFGPTDEEGEDTDVPDRLRVRVEGEETHHD